MAPDRPAPASRLVAGVATLGAVVLLAGVAVGSRGTDPADLTTTVSSVSPGAVVVTAAGSHPAKRGEALPRGAQLRTAGGPAVLTTRGRRVELAEGTAVTVLDGERQRLAEGSALVVAGEGPALVLSTATARLEVPSQGVARLDGGDLLRVASYVESVRVGVPGRRAETTVEALYQLEVPAGSTPGQPTPLALTEGDAWEQAVLREVVANDDDLRALAQEFSLPGSVVAAELPPVPGESDRARGERALALALASGDPRRPAYAGSLALRAQGGSWGVVARLVETSVSDAEGYLEALSGPARQEVLAAAPDEGEAVVPGLVSESPAAPTAEAVPDAPSPVPSPGTSPRPRPTAAPGPSPTPSPAPVLVVPDPVASVLAPVLDLLPVEVPLLPKPSPTASRKPQLPVVGPLLDGLLSPAPVTR